MANTPEFLPGKSHGQKRLAGYSPWGHKELAMTKREHRIYNCVSRWSVVGVTSYCWPPTLCPALANTYTTIIKKKKSNVISLQKFLKLAINLFKYIFVDFCWVLEIIIVRKGSRIFIFKKAYFNWSRNHVLRECNYTTMTTVLDAMLCGGRQGPSEYGEIIPAMVAESASLTRYLKSANELAPWENIVPFPGK